MAFLYAVYAENGGEEVLANKGLFRQRTFAKMQRKVRPLPFLQRCLEAARRFKQEGGTFGADKQGGERADCRWVWQFCKQLFFVKQVFSLAAGIFVPYFTTAFQQASPQAGFIIHAKTAIGYRFVQLLLLACF